MKKLAHVAAFAAIAVIAAAQSATINFTFTPNKGTYKKGEPITVNFAVAGLRSSDKPVITSSWYYENNGKVWGPYNTKSVVLVRGLGSTLTEVPIGPSTSKRYKFLMTIAGSTREVAVNVN